MAGVKISDLTPDASVAGTELVPVSDSGVGKSVTIAGIKSYVVDQIEAITAGSVVSGSDSIFILQSGVLKPVDIDVVAQHVIDTVWGKAAESSPASGDKLALKDDSSVEKTVTLANIAEYVRATIEAAILDVSDLADGSGSLGITDYLLITQGTTGKRIQVVDLVDLIYEGLKAYVTALTAVTVATETDIFYCIQGGAEKKVTLAEIATFLGNPPSAPATTTQNGIPQWSNETGDLKDGLQLVTEISSPGDDSTIPSAQAVDEAMSTIVYDQDDIAAALADEDTFMVDDGDAGTAQRKSAMSRVWTYILAKLQALTTLAGFGFFVDEDNMASDSATKVPSQQSVKAYVDSKTGDIANIDLDGGTDIGAALADADLILVDDGASGTNRKSALSRVWTYIQSKFTIASIDLDGGTDIGADLADADLILVDDGAGGTNRKSAISRMWTYIWSKVSGASAKSPPVNGDSIPIVDSEASSVVKLLTFTGLKSFLKTYFDPLYSASHFVVMFYYGIHTYTTAVAGTWALFMSGLGGLTNTTTADADEVSISIWVPTGTYRISVCCNTSTDGGKFDTYIDSTNLGNTDTYAGSPSVKLATFTGVALGGSHALKFKLNGKHASSSDYVLVLNYVGIQRTA